MTDDAPLPTSLPAWIPERKKSRGEPTSSSNGDFTVLKKKNSTQSLEFLIK